ncbi:MAG TPA: MarP family serine protease [Gaiellaceae bacterium]|nr:MarP family serine protease [Gaiellaceae bacterium]
MTAIDVLALILILGAALAGYRRGLVAGALSAIGILLGAWIGSRIGPDLLRGGEDSPYQPLAALAGAAVGAILLETLGAMAGSAVRGTVRLPPLRTIDSAGGLVLGALSGLVVVWVLGAVALFVPGETGLRRAAQQSAVLRQLNGIVPPQRLLGVLARIDPFPTLAGRPPSVAPPDPRLVHLPFVEAASQSVVRVLGTACGLGVEGSGFVAANGLVVTAAHVVAGERDTVVELSSGERLSADAVAFDSHNDVAVLRVDGLDVKPLRLATPRVGAPVAVLGYPEDGPFAATPGRIGPTQVRLTQDAYGQGHIFRELTSLRGVVRHGNSGSPAVDRNGAVETMVFAALVGARGGLGVPSSIVGNAVVSAEHGGTVSTGGCAR